MCISVCFFRTYWPYILWACLQFKRQLQSVAVDGIDILAAARDAGQKALAKLKAREAAAKAAAKREEERVTGLKKVRGERWLPSMAKNRHMGFQGC